MAVKRTVRSAVKAPRGSRARPMRPRDESFVAFAVEQLSALDGVRAKGMFGGHGLYARETFFAVVDEGRLYFKVDDSTRPRYVERGMGPFAPSPSMVMKGYYEVPLDVLEDAPELVRWAREACEVAGAKKARKATPPGKPARSPRTPKSRT